jgi:mannose-1-phosphate guanylyltransferase
MQIDYALILGAGLGTRMGEIGKIIPKILWPIYFKTMLELQIRYCEELEIKKIYLNTHFLHHEIVQFLDRSNLADKVTVLHEDILLDSGGAIHNLAIRPEVNYRGNVLLVNGDQYLFFEKKFWEEALAGIGQNRAVLFGITVDKSATYNETIVVNNVLVDIKKRTGSHNNYVTYSGLGLLNLNGLVPILGVSKFFETVANYRVEKVKFITPDVFEYWDFGTAEIFAENIF